MSEDNTSVPEKCLDKNEIYLTAYLQHLDNKIPASTADNQPNQD